MRRKPAAAETIGDLLRPVIAARKFTSWCEDAGLRPQTVAALIDGTRTAVRRRTLLALSTALGVSVERVRAAIEASRLAGQ